jgi:hypothetical protein
MRHGADLKMVFSRLFRNHNSPDPNPPAKRLRADSFADALGLELKGVVSQAVLKELESREQNYLSSILDKSHFLIDAIVITPLDKQASESLENFLRVHSDIDPEFRNHFFRSILESEYRSARGSTVIVAEDFLPSIQLTDQSFEQPTQDETFQISLRGRRLQFQAQVALKGPVAKEHSRLSAEAQSGDSVSGLPGLAISRRASLSEARASGLILSIHDAQGQRTLELRSPILIGREPPGEVELEGLQFVSLHGRYVSRRHLVVMNILEDTYFFLHDAATLSCLSSGSQLLRPSTLYSIPRNSEAELIFGMTAETRNQAASADPADFPRVTLGKAMGRRSAPSSATPRPGAL